MDYGQLIRVAWALARRHRFLWLLGLFAVSGVSSCSTAIQAPFWGSSAAVSLAPGVFGALDALGSLQGLDGGGVSIILGVVLLFLVGIALLSSIATAGMAHATTALIAGGSIAPGAAWRTGLRRFPRYLGLALLGLAYVVVAILVVAVVLFLTIAAGGSGSSLGTVAALVLGLMVLGAVLASVVGAVGYVVACQYAVLEMGVADVGPVRALRAGLALTRRELGTTIVLWAIALLIGAGASILMVVAFLLLAAALAAIGAVVYFATAAELASGVPLTTVVFAVMAAAVAIVVLWGVAAFLNSFFWAYWAAAYLRLTKPDQPPRARNASPRDSRLGPSPDC